jgi:hydroxypyruvate reductase
MFDAASASAQPSRCVPPHLPAPPKGHTIVVGAGKASAAMAKALDENWRGDVDDLVVTRYGYSAPCCRIEIIEAAHPVPDAARVTAAQRILECVRGITPDDLVVCLTSGGGSALLTRDSPNTRCAAHRHRAALEGRPSVRRANSVRLGVKRWD